MNETINPAHDADAFRYDPDGPAGPLHLPDGRALTRETVDDLADLAERNGPPAGLVPGGKSLSGDGTHSPRVQVVLARDTAEKVRVAAQSEGMSVSRWIRRLVERNVA